MSAIDKINKCLGIDCAWCASIECPNNITLTEIAEHLDETSKQLDKTIKAIDDLLEVIKIQEKEQ